MKKRGRPKQLRDDDSIQVNKPACPSWYLKALANANYADKCYIPTKELHEKYPGMFENLYINRTTPPDFNDNNGAPV